MSDHESHEADGAPHTMVELRDMNEALNAMDGDPEASLRLDRASANRVRAAKDAELKTRMAVEATRREAYHRASLGRARETTAAPFLDVAGVATDDGRSYEARIRIPGRTEPVSLQSALGVEGVEIVLGGGKRTKDRVALSMYPDSPSQYLEVVRQLLVSRAERWNPEDRSKNDKALMDLESARGEVEDAYQTARRDRETSFEEKKAVILGAEGAFLKKLKAAETAMKEEFEWHSQEFFDREGVHLESVLGLREHDVENFLKAFTRSESHRMTVPWEKTVEGYKNRATGKIEEPTDLKERWRMYTSTHEVWQDGMIMEALRKGLSPKERAGQRTKDSAYWMWKEFKLVPKAGLVTGAVFGLGVRALWRTFLEVPFYYLDRWFDSVKTDMHSASEWLRHGKSSDAVLGGLGGLLSWIQPSDKKKMPAPWTRRGDPPMFGPLNRLRKAMFAGERWQEDKEKSAGGGGGGAKAHGGGGGHH